MNLFRIIGNVKVRVDKEDILRFEVCVRELVVVQESDGVAQLVSNVPDLVQRIRLVVVVFLHNQIKHIRMIDVIRRYE